MHVCTETIVHSNTQWERIGILERESILIPIFNNIGCNEIYTSERRNTPGRLTQSITVQYDNDGNNKQSKKTRGI